MDNDKSILEKITETVKDIANIATNAASQALSAEEPSVKADKAATAYLPLAADGLVIDPMMTPPLAAVPVRKRKRAAKPGKKSTARNAARARKKPAARKAAKVGKKSKARNTAKKPARKPAPKKAAKRSKSAKTTKTGRKTAGKTGRGIRKRQRAA